MMETVNGILTIPPGTERIDDGAFAGRDDIARLVLPEGLREIGEGAFSGCVNIKQVSFPKSLEQVEDQAFFGCGSLQSVTFPETLRQLGHEVFLLCPSLTTATVPGRETKACADAFGGAYLRDNREYTDWFDIDQRSYVRDGYFGFPFWLSSSAYEKWLYASLLCIAPERYRSTDRKYAAHFIEVLERDFVRRIIEIRAPRQMAGLIQMGLLSRQYLDEYLAISARSGDAEISAMLLGCMGRQKSIEEELLL